MPTEFDPTTDALLRTITVLGVTDEQLHADMDFLTDFFTQVSSHDVKNIPAQRTTEVLDCAFIGLVYHRHMPFKDFETEETIRPPRDPNNYTFTLSAVSASLARDRGLSAEQIAQAAMEGGLLGKSHLNRDTDESDEQQVELRRQFLAMCMLGMIIHRLMWTTEEEPTL